MTTLKAATVEAILATTEIDTSWTSTRTGELFESHDTGWSTWQHEVSKPVTIPDLGSVEIVEQEGGGEGEGEHVHMVFKITADDGSVRFFQKNGFYASFDGTTWDDGEAFFEVAPVEKLVTVFDKVE